MEVTVERQPDGCLLKVGGEIDMSTSPALRAPLVELVDGKVTPITVDMSGVTYIDSSGIATLVECLQGTHEYGGELVLQELTEDVRDVFHLVRLDTIFTIR